jgi:transcriptional regulator with XRE-family HTH domain
MVKISEKTEAIKLRKKGYSLNEIAAKTGVAKSTASMWVRDIVLGNNAKKRLLSKIKIGQFVSAENKKKKTQKVLDGCREKASDELRGKKFDSVVCKIICAMIYWCEGAKNRFCGINFTNSDPDLIKKFLELLRKSFELDERKFRVCVHLHGYHNKERQIRFWSEITEISKNQFIKPYLKKNTGKRTRENYQGCVSIRYHDVTVARELMATAEAFLKM